MSSNQATRRRLRPGRQTTNHNILSLANFPRERQAKANETPDGTESTSEKVLKVSPVCVSQGSALSPLSLTGPLTDSLCLRLLKAELLCTLTVCATFLTRPSNDKLGDSKKGLSHWICLQASSERSSPRVSHRAPRSQ